MKRYTTNTKADPRKTMAVMHCGICVGKLAMPHSLMSPYSEFKIGPVRFSFVNAYTALQALDPIPLSWLVDLAADVQDLSDLA